MWSGAFVQDHVYLRESFLDRDYCTANVLIHVLDKGLSPCLASIFLPKVQHTY